MYKFLSEQLGVTPKSLQDLEVGWVPVVTFKRGRSFEGWFTIPMRDATGKICGLALRSREGHKVLYPGSKPGCFYVINPQHRLSESGYVHGVHNWTRTMDAARLCPICGKPDGCLLSRENPDDPKAVICRVKESDRKTRFGWLHIRKPEGKLSESLLTGEGKVLVVEGMSDVAAAHDLGFTGVGRPSNTGGQDIVMELVRGRETIVMGENDEKATGHWPGRDGMVATFATVRKVTPAAKMLLPPKAIKDLRAWVVVHHLTQDKFLKYLDTDGVEATDNLVLDNDNPLTVARGFIRDTYTQGKKSLIRIWEDNWYLYSETEARYSMVKDPPIVAQFYRWSEDKQVTKTTLRGTALEPLVATPYVWSSVKQASLADTHVEAANIPAWINGARGASPSDLVVFNNGILNVPAFLGGNDDYLIDTTPDYFNTVALPIAFDSTATCPTWLAFLNASLGDERAKIELLQEWFGYCMTPDTSRQKMMYLRGVTGGGKGTVLHVLQALVGEAQSVSTSFSDLAGPFGVAPLVGKLVALVWDARTPKSMDTMRGLEVLLNISGNDSLQVNRKFKDQLDGARLTCRVTIASNTFLDVQDHSGAMLRRLNVIEFQRTFAENPDEQLKDKLVAEIGGVAVWALQGLKRLRDQGRFTVPESSKVALQEWRVDTSPTASFLRDCTDADANGVVTRDELYDCWVGWAADFRSAPVTKSIFFQRVRANAPFVIHESKHFKGLRIKNDAARRYLGRP